MTGGLYFHRMRRLSILSMLLSAPCLHAQTDTITVGALERTYTVRLPSSYDGSTPLPLVIAMHGGFGSGTQLENQSQLSVKAEQEGFIVVYPDGVPSLIGIRTWNAGGCCGYAMNNGIDDVGFIDALLDTLFDELAIDTQRVYATGMSNGGFMSYRLACELSDRIAAIAPVSASMTIASCQPARPVPVISLHSYLDTSVPYLGGVGDGVSGHYNSPQDSVLNAFATHANCAVLNDTVQHDASMTVIRWHDCECGAEVITYRTQDGGHSWHGGVQSPIGDPPSQTVSANDLMWDFFQQHTLDCLSTGLSGSRVESTFVVMPQPTGGLVRIEGEGIAQATLLDALGRIVLVTRNVTGAVTWDLSALEAGRYLVRVEDPQGRASARPLLLVH